MHARTHAPAPGLRAAVLRDPVRRRGRRASRTWASTSPTRARATRARTRSAPTRTSRAAPTATRSWSTRDTCTLYELYAARWNGGNPKAGSGAIFDLTSERVAPGGLDQRRRGRPADLPGPAALRRGRGRRRSTTRSGDRGLHVRRATSGPRGTRPARTTGGCPPMGARFRLKAGFDASRLQPEGARRDPRDEALRADRGRQRQRLVLPGHGRSAAGPTRSSTS